MKIEQCPICYSSLEVKEFAPCDDCGGLEQEINHFKGGSHKYNVYEIYNGLKLQLCNFCDVDFGSYKSEYWGFLRDERIGYENFKFISEAENPTIQKTKFCPECKKGLKFLTFLRDIREIVKTDKTNWKKADTNTK